MEVNMKYFSLIMVLVILVTLGLSAVVSADDSKWVKTSMGLVYLDTSSPGFKMLSPAAQEAAKIIGYGNPSQYSVDGKNLDTAHWLAYDGQVTAYNNWFSYRAAETMGNQLKLPIGFQSTGDWYTIPVGK
jgi:hypothetical protein